MISSRTSLDRRLYRAALGLLPPSFRRDFSDDMQRDFEDDLGEAFGNGRRVGRWVFRARMLRDFVRTFCLQWLRSGWPAIVLLAMATTLTFTTALARMLRGMVIQLPSGSADEELIALEMLAVVVLLFIVATILLTMWSGRILQRRAGRRS